MYKIRNLTFLSVYVGSKFVLKFSDTKQSQVEHKILSSQVI